MPNWYTTGENIEFTVDFNMAISVAGDPVFAFALGSSPDRREAAYVPSASDTDTLVFHYTLQSTDEDSNGIYIWGQGSGISETNPGIHLDSNDSIKDGVRPAAKRKDAVLDHPRHGEQGNHGVSPLARVVSVEVTSDPGSGTDSDTYRIDEVIEITVTFNQAVTVAGDPVFRIHLGTGNNNSDTVKSAAYVASASTTTTLVFRYTVVRGDSDTDGTWIGDEDDTFMMDSDDTIRNAANAAAVLDHRAPGRKGGHKVDGAPPLVSNFDQGSDNNNIARGVRAQGFRTGSNSNGYTLHSVDIRVETSRYINRGYRFSMYVCRLTPRVTLPFAPTRSRPIQPVGRSRRLPALMTTDRVPAPSPSPSLHPPIPSFSGTRTTSWSISRPPVRRCTTERLATERIAAPRPAGR